MNNWEMPVLKDAEKNSCSICSKTFPSYDDLKRHKKVAHFAKGYQCKICEKVSFGKRNLDTHMSTHETYIDNRKPDWSCSICGQIFSAKHLLQRHTSQIHKEVKIKCELCAGDYKKSEMKVHRKSHGPKCFKCKICNFKCSVNTQVKQHMKAHTQGNSRKCNSCPMVFRCSGNLKKHEERIHNKANVSKNAECLTCGHRFQFSTQLQKRIKEIHFNERPFPCQSCTKCFKRRSHLKDHLILHSGTKPFKCELCGDSFAGDTSLRLHKVIHTNLKPHKCDICEKGFRQNHHLKTHQMVHNGDKLFPCSKCGTSFRDKGDLKKHQVVHTEEKSISCNLCDKLFSLSLRSSLCRNDTLPTFIGGFSLWMNI